MKTARFILSLVALAAATSLSAQLGGLGKFSDALNKAKKGLEKTKEVVDIGKKVSGQFSDEDEKMIGDSVALEIVSRYGGLWRDPDATRRVNLVGNALARYSDRPALEWRFGVLDSDTVNAFAAPGGYVFLTRGLYELADTDDLLAGVLAHEIAHITERHALQLIQKGEWGSQAGKLLMKRSSAVRDAQNTVNQVRAEASQISPELAQKLNVGVDKILETILVRGFEPVKEYQSDRVGRELALTSGYAPGGLRAVLVMLQARKADPKKLFPTHPSLANRLKELPDDPAPAEPATEITPADAATDDTKPGES